MRLLCVDHYFEQDIEALEAACPPRSRCWSVGWDVFYAHAVPLFPEEVFTGIEAYFRPEHAAARAAYAHVVGRALERLHRIYGFDAVLAPSDTFFWIRAPIAWCRERGIPFVVLQKEATIPPGWMEGPAREWGAISPFIADHMLVSSEHHRRFWINAGVEPERIVVTGQPRFDLYARPERHRTWPELGVPAPSRPVVLFLTYDANAYLPVIDRTGLAPWSELRDQTERILLELAEEGEVELFVKAHPQPAEDQSAHLAELARRPDVRVLDPLGDARQYIANADVVVGFQSTALLEALAAGRPTVYTWWTQAAHDHASALIPFHEERRALVVAESPKSLREAVVRAVRGGAPPQPEVSRELVERYLGPIDGQAAVRCWDELLRLAERGRGRAAVRGRPQTVAAAALAAAAWGVAARAAGASYLIHRVRSRLRGREPAPERSFRDHVLRRSRRAAQELRASVGR